MATVYLTDHTGKRTQDDRVICSSWEFDGDDTDTTWAPWNGGRVLISVTDTSTFGGGTVTWYQRVTIKGIERIFRMSVGVITTTAGNKSVDLARSEVRPLLTGSTSPALVALIC